MSWKDPCPRTKAQGMPKLHYLNAGCRFAHWRQEINWSFVLCCWPFALLLLTACSPPDTPDTRSLDSKLFSHAQVIGDRGGGAGQFNKPRSVGLDGDDNIFVIDITGRVQKFSPTGEFLLSWQMPETDKGKAKGMDTDRDGNVLLIEPHYMRVNHFVPSRPH
jgi:hypothetical protein